MSSEEEEQNAAADDGERSLWVESFYLILHSYTHLKYILNIIFLWCQNNLIIHVKVKSQVRDIHIETDG